MKRVIIAALFLCAVTAACGKETPKENAASGDGDKAAQKSSVRENIYDFKTEKSEKELVTTLIEDGAVRIERVISTGQTTDGWYNQEEDEYVVLLDGSAEIEYKNGRKTSLAKGDSLFISAHEEHRVSFTSETPPCVWLCAFWPATEGSDIAGVNFFNLPSLSPDSQSVTQLLQNASVTVNRIAASGSQADWQAFPADNYIVLADGQANVEYESGEKVSLKSGDTLLIPANESHKLTDASSEPICVIMSVAWNAAQPAAQTPETPSATPVETAPSETPPTTPVETPPTETSE
ncbi:MAG: cupin domain-containing protein [Clostridiales bacterium]|jgi:cupin 2 domain-containing protein|nr:cupin domain-containing protein [Clostridiales bacterium]